jgi:hypothetical protein
MAEEPRTEIPASEYDTLIAIVERLRSLRKLGLKHRFNDQGNPESFPDTETTPLQHAQVNLDQVIEAAMRAGF